MQLIATDPAEPPSPPDPPWESEALCPELAESATAPPPTPPPPPTDWARIPAEFTSTVVIEPVLSTATEPALPPPPPEPPTAKARPEPEPESPMPPTPPPPPTDCASTPTAPPAESVVTGVVASEGMQPLPVQISAVLFTATDPPDPPSPPDPPTATDALLPEAEKAMPPLPPAPPTDWAKMPTEDGP